MGTISAYSTLIFPHELSFSLSPPLSFLIDEWKRKKNENETKEAFAEERDSGEKKMRQCPE